VAKAIGVVDAALARLVSGLRTRALYQQVNMIVVSDHGMASVPPNQTVIIDDYFDAKRARQIVWGSELTNIFAKAGDEAGLISSLRRKELRHARCYPKAAVPARFHYRDSSRIGTIVCMAEEGWRMVSRTRYEEDQKRTDRPTNVRGAHGYDNQLRSMRAIFVARGPSFRKGITIGPFPNVNVYDIMASVLYLKPARNDGSPGTARAVLK
jgi:predicted AlkP superfamily pyrophosphatase or phosphodiesterase